MLSVKFPQGVKKYLPSENLVGSNMDAVILMTFGRVSASSLGLNAFSKVETALNRSSTVPTSEGKTLLLPWAVLRTVVILVGRETFRSLTDILNNVYLACWALFPQETHYWLVFFGECKLVEHGFNAGRQGDRFWRRRTKMPTTEFRQTVI